MLNITTYNIYILYLNKYIYNGGLIREGGLISFFQSKGGLISEEGLFEGGGAK